MFVFIFLRVDYMPNKAQEHVDKATIESLGGVTKLAALLGYTVQRVGNWTRRGIPASVKLEHQSIFLKNLGSSSKAKKV